MSKPIIERTIDNLDKNELENPTDNFKNITMKLNYIIDYEIIDAFQNILNIPRMDFINSVVVKLRNFLRNEYSVKTFDEEILKNILSKSKDRLEKIFNNHLQNLTSTWEKFQIIKKNNNKNNELHNYYFKNYVYHCNYISEYAIHNCEKKIFGKFIKVYDKTNEKNKNQTRYLICENCKKTYFIEHFLNFCEKCQLNYYSTELNSNIKDILPATLKDPHCEPVVNEKLHCQYCKHTLYLNLSTNQLKCLNCRFVSSQKNMDWKCNICSKSFKSDVIVYNKSEVNYIKKIISYGLLMKKLAHPVKLPCCKNLDTKTTIFYHKKECKGTIYFAEFHSKLIIICEKCKAVNNFKKFIWTCPECSLRFKDTNWEENELKLRKEIFNRKDIKLNYNLEKENTAKNLKKNKIKLSLNENNNSDNKEKNKIKIKKKKNLYDILRKRTNYLSENNQLNINKPYSQEEKHLKKNKELDPEVNGSKNINNINSEPNKGKGLLKLIKVEKNNFIPLTENNSPKKKFILNSDLKNKIREDKSFEKKNFKKRYIFEKLVRKQFVSENNLIENNSEKKSLGKINLPSNNRILELESKKHIVNSNDSKNYKRPNKKIDIIEIPLSFKFKRLNKGSDLYNSQNLLFHKKENQSFTENKSTGINKKITRENTESKERKENNSKEIINSKSSNKNLERINNKNNNQIPEEKSLNKLQTEKNIRVKRYLFRLGHKERLEEIKINNQNIENIKSDGEKEKDIKFNRIISLKENGLNRKFYRYENSKSSENSDFNNKIKNEKQKDIINHCALNNIGLRKLYKDSFYFKKSEKEMTSLKEYNKNPKNKEVNENEKTLNENTIKGDYKNNLRNSKKITDNLYISTSMKMFKVKRNLIKKSDDEKQSYKYNTYKKKFENNEESNDEETSEDEEDNTPNDIVMVYSIDKMESIPMNPATFGNTILFNNTQQRLKHMLFRARLPLFNVDNYTIIKTLGEGTNGVIYQVVSNTTKKNYAMKKIVGNNITELEYLQKEFQICHQNPHRYILDIYGICARCFDSTTYVLYVLMDLAEKALDKEIAERFVMKKYYKESELISMMKKLVSALYYLQKDRKVAHRDIKPENILLFKKGKVLKLADFGEAKVNNENKKKKTIRGTEFYMSPILYEGNLKAKFDIQHNPFKSDVFSLGYCFVLATALDPEIINEIRKITEREEIEKLFNKYFPKGYSDKYIDLLLKMIAIDENKRVDFIGLDKILQNF